MIKRVSGTLTILSTDDAKYECEICKDTEWVDIKDEYGLYSFSAPCKCREANLYKKILESCGIAEAFLTKIFNNYKVINRQTEVALNTSMDYTNTFNLIRNTKNNSLALLGQVGSGKTHLTIAIANELMKKNIGVRYMQYREDIPRIKQSITDEVNYNKEINKYKNATVLLIDDLFKRSTIKNQNGEYLNDADSRIMFEIINHRYFKGLPIIVSSEFSTMDLLNLDEAIGSRILEMCKGHIVEIHGVENNYRLRGN